MSRFLVLSVLLAFAAGLVGCQQPTMDEMMKRPARPIELDRLNMFVGQWEGTGECTAMDEKMTTKGTSNVAWEGDKWILVEHFEYAMGDKGDKMKGVGIWTWDPKAEKYRTYMFDSYGGVGQGTAEFDEKTNTWSFQTKSRWHDGSETVGEGTCAFKDKNTMEWEFSERGGLMNMTKIMEMKGTSRKK